MQKCCPEVSIFLMFQLWGLITLIILISLSTADKINEIPTSCHVLPVYPVTVMENKVQTLRETPPGVDALLVPALLCCVVLQ